MRNQTKNFSPDFRQYQEVREKRLDKVAKLCYNTYRGYKGKVPKTMKEFIKVENERFNKRGVLAGALESLKYLDEAVKEASVKAGLKIPPVIAGGAVRDVALGLPVRDYDVFLLGLEQSPEGQDDVTYFMSKIKGVGRFEDLINAKTKYRGAPDTSVVEVYSVPFLTEMDPPFREGKRLVATDVIGRTEGTVEDLIEDFDHALCRCYYDDGLVLRGDMIEALTKGRVESRDFRAEDRLRAWRDRTGYKIVIGRPPKSPPTPTTGYGILYESKGKISRPVPFFRDQVRLVEPVDLGNAAAQWFDGGVRAFQVIEDN